MNNYILKLKAIEPLVLTDGSAEGMGHSILEFVPGSMLLGAFAARWVRQNKEMKPAESVEFRRLFLTGDLSWGPAYPSIEGVRALPVPLTYMKYKNSEGLASYDSEKAEEVINSLHIEQSDPHVSLKKISDQFMLPDSCCKVGIEKLWNMHVAIDLKKRTASDGQLFGYEASAKGQEYISVISCADDLKSSFEKIVQSGILIKVGHSRSAGYGAVEIISLESAQPESGRKEVNGCLHAYFESDYISCNSWVSPLEDFAKEISEELNVQLSLADKDQFCDYRTISGFNGLWKLPVTSRTAIQKGSVVTLEFEQDMTDVPERVVLGRGHQEGYGAVRLNPEFLMGGEIVTSFSGTSNEETAQQVQALQDSSIARVLTRRAARRQIGSAALDFLEEQGIAEMVKGLGWGRQLSQSQISRVRYMVQDSRVSINDWVANFKELLGKTPGEQWRRAVVYSPFSNRKEHMSEVMLDLLDKEKFQSRFSSILKLDLPLGGKNEKLQEDFQRTALGELFAVWVACSRSAEINRIEE